MDEMVGPVYLSLPLFESDTGTDSGKRRGKEPQAHPAAGPTASAGDGSAGGGSAGGGLAPWLQPRDQPGGNGESDTDYDSESELAGGYIGLDNDDDGDNNDGSGGGNGTGSGGGAAALPMLAAGPSDRTVVVTRSPTGLDLKCQMDSQGRLRVMDISPRGAAEQVGNPPHGVPTTPSQ